jgi:hypothetical protein
MLWSVWLVLWAAMGALVALLAKAHGRDPVGWFFYGVLIWPVALIHVIVAGPTKELMGEPTAPAGRREPGLQDHADGATALMKTPAPAPAPEPSGDVLKALLAEQRETNALLRKLLEQHETAAVARRVLAEERAN